MSLTDYSALEQEIGAAEESQALPAGTEASFRIVGVNTGVSEKNGCRWFNIVMDVPSEPLAKEFRDFFWDLDVTNLTAKQYAQALHKFKVFAAAITLDFSRPFNWEEDLVGMTGWCILGIKTDDTYGPQNTVKKYVAGN